MSSRWIAGLAIVWIGLVLAGLATLAGYETTPGRASAAPASWPADSRIERNMDRYTLVMFMHPQCPCSRASLIELEQLMTRYGGGMSASVVFFRPPGSAPGWENTGQFERAGRIPGVSVLVDEGGLEAGRFRVATSGQTFLYDAGGSLLFSGGITGARGHIGDNVGRRSVAALISGLPPLLTSAPVFGCPLIDDHGPARPARPECRD